MFGRKPKNSVTIRFEGKTYTLQKGWTFVPDIRIGMHGDIAGELRITKQFPIEVISID